MKAILVGNEPNDIFAIVDSAIGRDAMPLFIPDTLGELQAPDAKWMAQVRIAFRVGRLGKSISAKFAARYIDAVSAVAVTRPFPASGPPPAWLSIMDSALTTGQWLPMPDADIVMECAGQRVHLPDPWSVAAKALSRASSIATLKTGDLIVPAICPIDLPLVAEERFAATINDVECLHIKVK